MVKAMSTNGASNRRDSAKSERAVQQETLFSRTYVLHSVNSQVCVLC